MLLNSSFSVPVGPDRAWELLTDVERVAPCVPGLELTGGDGDHYQGRMRVKVGPVTARYECSMRFARLDREARIAVLAAEGRELRGQGTAAATVTTQMGDNGAAGATRVELATELSLTGRLAQFGRGVMEDVSTRLVDQFAERLQRELSAPVAGHGQEDGMERSHPASGAQPEGALDPPTSAATGRPPEAPRLDLLSVVAAAVARRGALPFATLVLGVALGLLLVARRRSSTRGNANPRA